MTAFTAKHPDYDATVAIEIRNGIIQFDFLAQGRSQRKKGGVVVGYSKRNPERRLLFNHIIEWLKADMSATPICLGVAYGKGPVVDTFKWVPSAGIGEVTKEDVRALFPIAYSLEEVHTRFKRGKSFRFRMFVTSQSLCEYPNDIVEDMVKVMGLVPSKHKPVTTEWYGLDS